MKLIFYTNPNKPGAGKLINELSETAENSGVSASVARGEDELNNLSDEAWDGALCVVTVGGDGTILRAVKAASRKGIPVLGVNLGRVGFFSEISADGFVDALGKLERGEFFVESPSLVSCTLNGECMGECLNDFVLHRQELSSITHLDLEIDGVSVGTVMADGLIVSTPSGSTAYTMSAGGPVVAPRLDCVLVTPICPHSLTVRPIVASGDSLISVRLRSACRLTGDGLNIGLLEPGDELEFTMAVGTAKFIRFENRNVFKLIREKLK